MSKQSWSWLSSCLSLALVAAACQSSSDDAGDGQGDKGGMAGSPDSAGQAGGTGGSLPKGGETAGGAGGETAGGAGGETAGGTGGTPSGGAGGTPSGGTGGSAGGTAGTGGMGGSKAGLSFFLTSANPGEGGDLGGLDGADAHCKKLAMAVGAGDRMWRAYLSTDMVDARTRIGTGPWQNAKGVVVAASVDDLHSNNNKLNKENSVDESGKVVNGRGDTPNRHDILTGSNANGTRAMGKNCMNWTSSASQPVAVVGHHDRVGNGANATSWNAAHDSRGCSLTDLRGSGGDGLFYCFAAD